ncbi:uncharacterized protein LOC111466227 [Cucurbita maxima]|uniref:Uncharacterized protein LOC111466227 n=1 Tax=Cucurbita maxima TaxID=3661 RepID=A0A6J1HS25_CUCMA|nr:uncharacterized protein LOC111466227 [Cucurbita maxima]
MAESLDDGEFWLPPKFLNDDDLFLEEKCVGNDAKKRRDGAGVGLHPFEYSLGFWPVGVSSDLGSPVESLIGSSETESDEEEYIAGLMTQMARSTLEDGFELDKSHGWRSSGSPQSTLCTVGSGCGCKQSSSRGSPNAQSLGSHPQLTLDLLYAAAGEVSKMRMNEEAYNFVNNRGHSVPPRKPSPVSVPLKNRDTDAGVYQQLQASQFLHLKRQQLIEQINSAARVGLVTGSVRHPQPQVPQNRGRNSEFFDGRNCRSAVGLTSQPPWAPPPPPRIHSVNPSPNGSGMRAVFLGVPGGKRECAGTGVFLPRQSGAVSETRKKPTCSTVLVPARVMKALNLNLDDMYVQRTQPQQLQSRSPSVFNPGKNDISGRGWSERLLAHQKAMNLRAAVAGVNQEIGRLPQEWSY